MLAPLSLLALLAALAPASAVSPPSSSVIIDNKCDVEVGMWHVGKVESPREDIQPGSSKGLRLYRDPQTGGRDVKIAPKPAEGWGGNPLAAPHLLFPYTVVDSPASYMKFDLVSIYSAAPPFSGDISLTSPNCPGMHWAANATSPMSANPDRLCSSIPTTFTLTLCASHVSNNSRRSPGK